MRMFQGGGVGGVGSSGGQKRGGAAPPCPPKKKKGVVLRNILPNNGSACRSRFLLDEVSGVPIHYKIVEVSSSYPCHVGREYLATNQTWQGVSKQFFVYGITMRDLSLGG